jgi:hypothetical protein
MWVVVSFAEEEETLIDLQIAFAEEALIDFHIAFAEEEASSAAY